MCIQVFRTWVFVALALNLVAHSRGQICTGRANIILGLDSSQSLDDKQFSSITQYAVNLLKRMKYPDTAAVMTFSNTVQLVTDFGEFIPGTDAEKKILNYVHMNIPATRIDHLIRNMTHKFLTDPKIHNGLPMVGVIVTDGRNTGLLKDLKEAAEDASRKMIDIVTVGVGNFILPDELNILTNGIVGNVIQSPTFQDLLTNALDKSAEKICQLSHNGDITSQVCSGFFVLAIHLDVTDANFLNVKLLLLDILMKRLQFQHRLSDVIITVGRSGEKTRFSDTNGLVQFIGQVQNHSPDLPFDPVNAYNLIRGEFDKNYDFVQNIALFISDKHIENPSNAKSYFFNTVNKEDGVHVVTMGIIPSAVSDELLDLSNEAVMHRVLTSQTSILTSGRNKLTESLCYIISKSPVLETFEVPSEVIVGFEYCPKPQGKDTQQTFLKYTSYLQNLIKRMKVGPDAVQITGETFCRNQTTMVSSKSHYPTFHVQYGLQDGGLPSDLTDTISQATNDTSNKFNGLRTKNKIIFVIFNDNYIADPLVNGIFEDAIAKGIKIVPIVLYQNDRSQTDTLTKAVDPYYIKIDNLSTFNYQNFKMYLEDVLKLDLSGWSDVAVITAGNGMTPTTLTKIQTFVSKLKELYIDPNENYGKSIQEQLKSAINENIKYTVRDTSVPIRHMMKKKTTRESDVNILLLVVMGKSTVPGLREAALKAKNQGIKIFAIGCKVDKDTIEELRYITNLTSGKLEVIPDFSAIPRLITGTGSDIWKIAQNANSAAHIMVAIDSANDVTDAQLDGALQAVDNIIFLWSFKRFKNATITIGVFSDFYIDIASDKIKLMAEDLRQQIKSIQHLNNASSFTRALSTTVDRLVDTDNQAAFTPVAVFITVNETLHKYFDSLAKAMLNKYGIALKTVGINSDLFADTIQVTPGVLSDPSSAPYFASKVSDEITNNLTTGHIDFLMAVDAGQTLDDDIFRWMKSMALKMIDNLKRKTNFRKFGIVGISSYDYLQDIVEIQKYEDMNFIKYIQSILKYTRLPPRIRTDSYMRSLLGLVDVTTSKKPKAAIILQDENSVSRSDTRSAALAAKDYGINLISIGVGSEVDNNELDSISYFTTNYTKRLSSLDELDSEGLRWTVEILNTIAPIHLNNRASLTLQDCKAAGDVAFAMDASMSLKENYFDAIKATVMDVSRYLIMAPDAFRVRGVLTFDGYVVEIAKDEEDKDELIQKILEAKFTKGVTRIDLALSKITEYLTNSPKRPGVPTIGVLITDGKSRDPQLTRREARKAVEANITLVAVAIGNEISISRSELMDVVANRTENLIWLKTFDELKLYGAKRLLDHICGLTKSALTTQIATTKMVTTAQPTAETTTLDIKSLPPFDKITDAICEGCAINAEGFGYVAHPNHCDRYVVCSSAYTVLSVQDCPLHTFWNSKSLSCHVFNATVCPKDQCKGKADNYNYTTPRMTEDVATCSRYYTCMNQRTHHVCECMGRIENIKIEGVLVAMKRQGERFDPGTNTCVVDYEGQCSTYIDPKALVESKEKLCHRTALNSTHYRDDISKIIYTCPKNYLYKAELCQCVQKFSAQEMGGQGPNDCKPFISYTFDDDDVNDDIKHLTRQNGKGVFKDNDDYIEIYRLANNYDNTFAVQITLQRVITGNMHIFKNCLLEGEATLSMFFTENSTDVYITAELKTESGSMRSLTMPSPSLKNNNVVTITLVADEDTVALRVANSNGQGSRTVKHDISAAGNKLNLQCNSLLTVGGNFGNGTPGFRGLMDSFAWYKGSGECIPSDIKGIL